MSAEWVSPRAAQRAKSTACDVRIRLDATEAATTRRTTDAFFIAPSSPPNVIPIKTSLSGSSNIYRGNYATLPVAISSLTLRSVTPAELHTEPSRASAAIAAGYDCPAGGDCPTHSMGSATFMVIYTPPAYINAAIVPDVSPNVSALLVFAALFEVYARRLPVEWLRVSVARL